MLCHLDTSIKPLYRVDSKAPHYVLEQLRLLLKPAWGHAIAVALK